MLNAKQTRSESSAMAAKHKRALLLLSLYNSNLIQIILRKKYVYSMQSKAASLGDQPLGHQLST